MPRQTCVVLVCEEPPGVESQRQGEVEAVLGQRRRRSPGRPGDDQALVEHVGARGPGKAGMVAVHPFEVRRRDVPVVEVAGDHRRRRRSAAPFRSSPSSFGVAMDELGGREGAAELLDLVRLERNGRQHAA